jgi:hypothetical protein
MVLIFVDILQVSVNIGSIGIQALGVGYCVVDSLDILVMSSIDGKGFLIAFIFFNGSYFHFLLSYRLQFLMMDIFRFFAIQQHLVISLDSAISCNFLAMEKFLCVTGTMTAVFM